MLTRGMKKAIEAEIECDNNKMGSTGAATDAIPSSTLTTPSKIKPPVPEKPPGWLLDMMDNLKENMKQQFETFRSELRGDIGNLKASVDFACNTANDALKKTTEQDVKINHLESSNNELRSEIHELKQKLDYLESQSRRNNLVFDGINEDKDETWATTEKKLTEIISKQLEIKDLKFDRVHRSNVSVPDKPRSVIAKFHYYKDKDTVWLNRYKLGSKIRVTQDFPSEVKQNRQILWPIYMAAKQSSEIKSAQLRLDKLFINNRMFTVDTITQLPACLKPEKICHRQTENTFVFLTKNSMLSNYYPCEIQHNGQIFNCSEQGYQYAKAKYFHDNDTARMIMNETVPSKMSTLGKSVKGYQQNKWLEHAPDILKQINEAKFAQNAEVRQFLLSTNDKKLGEASLDPFFGTGVHLHSRTTTDENTWTGKNIMGSILDKIRQNYKSIDEQ